MYSCRTNATGHILFFFNGKIVFQTNIFRYWYLWCLSQSAAAESFQDWNKRTSLSCQLQVPDFHMGHRWLPTNTTPAFKIWARASEPGVVNINWLKMCALVMVPLQWKSTVFLVWLDCLNVCHYQDALTIIVPSAESAHGSDMKQVFLIIYTQSAMFLNVVSWSHAPQ